MSRDQACSVYIGNLDDKVSERVLYEILIQAGRVVELHIPLDKDTDRRKGFAFAQYESEEIAEYAVKLFTGLVCLNKRTLKFAISGSDKSSKNNSTFKSHANHPSKEYSTNNKNYHPSLLPIDSQDGQSQVYAPADSAREYSSTVSSSQGAVNHKGVRHSPKFLKASSRKRRRDISEAGFAKDTIERRVGVRRRNAVNDPDADWTSHRQTTSSREEPLVSSEF